MSNTMYGRATPNRTADAMPEDLPTDVEQQVLLAVWRLGEEAYGVPVRDELERVAGRDVSAGAVYATLIRLERKGWVRSSMGDPTPERGGKAKRFFRITSDGVAAVRDARALLDRLWEGLEGVAGRGAATRMEAAEEP